MKSRILFLTLVAAAGSFAAATHDAVAQSSNNSEGFAASCASAGAQPANESSSIQVALSRFDSALASRDMMQLQATGIDPASLKRFQKFFKDNPDATVTDSCPVSALFLAEDAAIWKCVEITRLGSERKAPPFEHAMQFMFAKKNGTWVISDRR